MHNRIIITFTFLYALLSAGFATAEELETSKPIFDQWSLYFYLGDHHADTTKNQLESPSSEFALGMGGGFDYSEYLDLGFDVLYASKSYDTPENVSCGPLFGCRDDMTIDTLGLNLTARLTYTMGITSFYTGVGTGLYFTELTLTTVIPGSHEESSNDLGYFYNFGVMLNISNDNYLGLEYRNLTLEANLSPITTEDVDIGGDFLLATYVVSF